MLDPRTGEVLALASTPTYDASADRRPGDGRGDVRGAPRRPGQPLLPRATLGRYVPGSVFKIVTAVAGLGSGAITPSTTYKQQPAAEKTASSSTGSASATATTRETGRRALDLVGATEVSCNIWYALTGLQTGGDDLSTYAAPDGLRRADPVRPADGGLAGQRRRAAREPGGFADDVELANAAYGQAETFVTPLQMALVAATVANDGVLMQPRLVRR